MEATNRRKIKKKDFEYELYQKYGLLEYRPHDTVNNETHLSTRLYLYYKNGTHVGTWCKGEGWEFVHKNLFKKVVA